MHSAEVKITYASAEEAQRAAQALAPDNGGYLLTTVEQDALLLRCEADSPMGLLRTLDDALGCLRAAGLNGQA